MKKDIPYTIFMIVFIGLIIFLGTITWAGGRQPSFDVDNIKELIDAFPKENIVELPDEAIEEIFLQAPTINIHRKSRFSSHNESYTIRGDKIASEEVLKLEIESISKNHQGSQMEYNKFKTSKITYKDKDYKYRLKFDFDYLVFILRLESGDYFTFISTYYDYENERLKEMDSIEKSEYLIERLLEDYYFPYF